MFANLYLHILANGMGRTRAELFRNSALKHGATLLDENKELPVKKQPGGSGEETADSGELGFSYNLRRLSQDKSDVTLQSIDTSVQYAIVVDENTIKTWENFEKAMSKKKFFGGLKERFESGSSGEARVVTSLWMSECLKSTKALCTKKYEINPPMNKKTQAQQEDLIDENSENSRKRKYSDDLSDELESSKQTKSNELISSDSGSAFKKAKYAIEDSDPESDYESDSTNGDDQDGSKFERIFMKKLSSSSKDSEVKPKFIPNVNTWTCAHSSKEQRINHNKFITDKLEEMSSIYESTKDKYRALGYQKAIHALKRCSHPIRTREEAIAVPGIGARLADKIYEIIQTGDLTKLDELNSREDINAIKVFTNVHGIGPTLAQQFLAQGFRTLEDLRTRAKLTRQQKIGLKYYDEFLQRIPRDECAKIEKAVKDAALSIKEGLIVQACGSYRRGKPTCGDVDVLITHPDGHSHKKIFSKVIELLHEQNFLTDDLVVQDEMSDETQRKYLGVCKLPEPGSLHRRLDIIVVPYNEYACALIYFTGSAHFNRSMRHLAGKMGMSLSEHSINKHVQRHKSEKINTGVPIPTASEEDVFKILNIKYRPPEERDF